MSTQKSSFACEDCGWRWPLDSDPIAIGAECDNCGGAFVRLVCPNCLQNVTSDGSHWYAPYGQQEGRWTCGTSEEAQ